MRAKRLSFLSVLFVVLSRTNFLRLCGKPLRFMWILKHATSFRANAPERLGTQPSCSFQECWEVSLALPQIDAHRPSREGKTITSSVGQKALRAKRLVANLKLDISP